MLRQFWKKHPTYNLNAMMRRRYEELMDAKAFNEWVANRRLEYADAMGRVTEAVNRRIPQLRWAGAERQQVLRAGDQSSAAAEAESKSMEEQRALPPAAERATSAEPAERLLAAWARQRWDWAWARWAEPTRALGTCSEATAATRPRAQAKSSKTCER